MANLLSQIDKMLLDSFAWFRENDDLQSKTGIILAIIMLILSVTAFNKTKPARLYLIACLFLSIITEAFIKYYHLFPSFSTPKSRYNLFYQIRESYAFLGFSIFLFCILFGVEEKKKKQSKQNITTNQIPERKHYYNLHVYRGEKRLNKTKTENPWRQKIISKAHENSLPFHDIHFARKLDQEDPLKSFRSEFHIPQEKDGGNTIYFCGNSLGLQPKAIDETVRGQMEKWQKRAVNGHFEEPLQWFDIAEQTSAVAKDVVGAHFDHEVVYMNTLTTNIHLLMVSFYRPQSNRFKILMEENPFPSDMHMVSSQVRMHGYDPEEAIMMIGPRKGDSYIETEDILDVIEKEGDSIALVLLSGIQFISGQFFDVKTITDAGHQKGCMVGWDMAHAAGNMELKLHDWDIDFAAWCSYKYLNCGPGNLAGIFIHDRHANRSDLPRFEGWFAAPTDYRFSMDTGVPLAPGAFGYQLSNPYFLGMASVKSSLEVFNKTNMKELRNKSKLLTAYLELLLDEQLKGKAQILTPRDPERRGCQLSIAMPCSTKEMEEKLLKKGIVVDQRDDRVIRVAPTPLYNTFEEVHQFVSRAKQIIEE
eukprot:gb/GECH01013105.1/.p1 GENE.gb/GECH01013105.1/~~gb/GECH01013105.1/.p1  ORF type:complete len:590 (+),score=146.47 gb/GECH01013105.1/:1-1770(+)